MEWYFALPLLLGGVIFLMMLGTPVAFAFLGVNVVGALVFLEGNGGLIQLARNAVDAVSSFSLAPIAMFVLMGEILFQTRLGPFDSASARSVVPGGDLWRDRIFNSFRLNNG